MDMDLDLPFIDCHIHFWDPAENSYLWHAGFPKIAGRHLPGDLHEEAGARVPAQMVFVEADATSSRPFGELLWVEKLASTEPRITAIVTQVSIDRGAESEKNIQLVREKPLVRGIRHRIEDEKDPGFCLRPEFVNGVRQVGAAGLSFDLCIKHHQLPAATELVRMCPETSFVLNHGGKPDVRGNQLDPWRANLRELAKLPNVTCKLAGLIAEADPTTWTETQLRPYMQHMLECFGPDRLVFGSDWPVLKVGATYRRWLDITTAFLSRADSSIRQAILFENARRVYRLT